jgi:hypothetical protein
MHFGESHCEDSMTAVSLIGLAINQLIESHDRLRTSIPVQSAANVSETLCTLDIAGVGPGELWLILASANATNDRASGADIGFSTEVAIGVGGSFLTVGKIADGVPGQNGGWDIGRSRDHHTMRSQPTIVRWAPNGTTEAIYPWFGAPQSSVTVELRGKAYNGSDASGSLTIDQAHLQIVRYVDTSYTPPPPPPPPPPGVPITHALTSTGQSVGDTTQYTFTQALGAEAPNRQIVVAVMARANSTGRSVTGLTINGIAAARDGRISNPGNGSDIIEIWRASVPTGVSATVIVTFNAAMLRCAIQTAQIVGPNIGVAGTASDISATSRTLSGTLNVVEGGAVIGAATGGQFVNTWTGLSKGWQSGNIEGGYYVSTASQAITAGNAAYPVSVSTDSGWYAPAMLAVSYAGA